MSAELILGGIVTVLALGVAAQWTAWRFRLPSILLLLVFGFVAGPVAGVLEGEVLSGEWVFAFVSLAIGIILFEGGLTLRFDELGEVGDAVRNLITVGVAVTWAGATTGAHYLAGFEWPLAVLVGALLTVTGPTVVGPLLRHVRPQGRVGTIAKWEGITIDPIGAILAVLVFEALLLFNDPQHAASFYEAASHTAEGLLTVVVVGAGVSVLGAATLVVLIRRGLLPDHLLNALSLTVVAGAFALSNVLYPESGLLTTTLMGIWMANQPFVPVRRIAEFKEDLQVLLIACLFIVLSARLDLGSLDYVTGGTLLFLAVLILLVRPLAVWASSLGTRLNWREWAFLSWLAPRGIVAAGVASLFALRLEAYFPAGQVDRLVPVVFLVIVGTAAVYGLTLAPVAQRLGLAQPSPQGVLVLGGHTYARQIALALDALGVSVLLIDSDADRTEKAQDAGLRAERANALDERVFENLDLGGLGRLFAMTDSDEVNALAALYFNEVFESAEVYQLAVHPEKARTTFTTRPELPRHLRGRPLFAENITCETLAERFDAGARLRFFEITEERSLRAIEEHYEPDHEDDEEVGRGLHDEYGHAEVVPLFLERANDLIIFSPESDATPHPGDCLVALVPPSQNEEQEWEAARTIDAVRHARLVEEGEEDEKPQENGAARRGGADGHADGEAERETTSAKKANGRPEQSRAASSQKQS